MYNRFAHGGHHHIAGAGADIENDVSLRFRDIDPCADGSRNGFFDQKRIACSRALRCFNHGTLLNFRGHRWHSNNRTRFEENPASDNPVEKQGQHTLGRIKIGDHAVLHRAYNHQIVRRAADKILRRLTDRDHLARAAFNGRDTRLAQNDSLSPDISKQIACAKIQTDIGRMK